MRLIIFLTWIATCGQVVLWAQVPCYTDAQYAVHSVYDIPYGTSVGFAGNAVTLRMNIHTPIGDHNTQRPVVVLLHGGGFIEGDRSAMDHPAFPLCQAFAARGYTAITISYRLGMQKSDLIGDALPCGLVGAITGVQAPVCGYILDQHEMYRAWYRAIQDARGAIRFIKNNLDSIDVNQVFVGGVSAGALSALGVAYLDQDEVNTTAVGQLSPAPFLAPGLFSSCYPGSSTARPPLGSPDGDIALGGPHDASVRGVVSIGGAVLDTAWIDADEAPLYLAHNTLDGVVQMGYGQPYSPAMDVCAPACANMNNNYPAIFGSVEIAHHLSQNLSNPMPYHLELIPCIPDCTTNGYCHAIDPELGDCLVQHILLFMSQIICPEPPPGPVCEPSPEARDLYWQNQLAGTCSPTVNVYRDIIYRTATNVAGQMQALKLDLYVPRWMQASDKRPLIVFFHGGGYLSTTENRAEFSQACEYFASLGYTAATVDYRVGWPNANTTDPCANDFSDLTQAAYLAWQDSREALNWLADYAGLVHIDPQQMVVAGYSAGAQLSLLNGFVSQAEIDGYRPELSAEFGPLAPLKGRIAAVMAMAGSLPSINTLMVGPERVPLLLLQGSCDRVTSPGLDPAYFCTHFPEPMYGALCMANFCAGNGIPYHLRVYEGMDHLFFAQPAVLEDALLNMRSFLYEQLICGQGSQQTSSYLFSSQDCSDSYSACGALVAIQDQGGVLLPELKVYPNPAVGSHFQLEAYHIPHGLYQLTLLDINGQLKHTQPIQVSNGPFSFQVELPAGVYLLQLHNARSCVTTRLISARSGF